MKCTGENEIPVLIMEKSFNTENRHTCSKCDTFVQYCVHVHACMIKRKSAFVVGKDL